MKNFTFLMLFCCAWMQSQFTTPGNGTSYTLSTLSAAAPNVVRNMGTFYMMMEDVTISATDQLIVDENTTLSIFSDKTLFVYGGYYTTANNFLINAVDAGFPFKGIQFEIGSNAEMKNTRIDFGGGIRVLTNNFLMDNCIVYRNRGGVSTGGAVSFFRGEGGSLIIKNSQFLENAKPAISSSGNATANVAAIITNNYFYGNNTENSNAPQINMGPSGPDSLKITNNTIIGNRILTKVGGIGSSALAGGTNRFRIENNTIQDNRFGITTYAGTSSGIIRNNVIVNNNTEPDPNNGGSGIAVYGAKDVLIRSNQIRGNLWGITVLSNGTVNLGSESDHGDNIFKNNGNAGNTVALFNNTSNPISALYNCWREDELSTDAMVSSVIGSLTPNTVSFKPYNCAMPLAVSETGKPSARVYPNPSKNQFVFETETAGNMVIQDFSGKVVYSSIINKGKNEISTNLPAGVYIITQQSEGKKSNTKLIIK